MSSTSVGLPKNFQDAKLLMDLIVQPALDLMKTELNQHAAKVEQAVNSALQTVGSFEGRVNRLEQTQKKALAGYAVFSTALAGVLAGGWSWIKNHFHWSVG